MSFDLILIIIHASLGGIALLSGLLAIASKKGSKPHRLGGKVFHLSMIASAMVAIVVTFLPDHESVFLFTIGVFSLYLVIRGKLALKYRKKVFNATADKLLDWMMILTGLGMVFYPVFKSRSINIILLVFGIGGLYLAIRNLMLLRNEEKRREEWLNVHLGFMTGGYISASSAFLVVNQVVHPYVAWFGPTIPGVIFIIYWLRKLNKKKTGAPAAIKQHPDSE